MEVPLLIGQRQFVAGTSKNSGEFDLSPFSSEIALRKSQTGAVQPVIAFLSTKHPKYHAKTIAL